MSLVHERSTVSIVAIGIVGFAPERLMSILDAAVQNHLIRIKDE